MSQIIDLCVYLNGTDNPGMKWYLDFFSSRLPKGVLHPCPYFGVLKVSNLTFDTELTNKLPSGQYFMKTRYFDDFDENIITTKLYIENIPDKIRIVRKKKQQGT